MIEHAGGRTRDNHSTNSRPTDIPHRFFFTLLVLYDVIESGCF